MRAFVRKQNQPQKPVPPSLARPNMATFGPYDHVHSVLHLQRTIGNQAVLRALQTDVAEHEAGLTGSVLPRLGHDFSMIPAHPPSAGNTGGAVVKRASALLQRQNRDGGQAANSQGDAGAVPAQGGNVTFLRFLNSGSGVTGRTLGPVNAGTVYGNGVEFQFSIPPGARQQYRNIRPTQWSGTETIWVRRGSPLGGQWQIHRQGPGTGLDDPLAPNIVNQNNLIAYYDSPGPDVLTRYLLRNPPSRVYTVQNFTGWIVGEPVTGGGAQRLCPVVAWYGVVDLVNTNWETPGGMPQWQRLGTSHSGQGWAVTNAPPI